MNDLFERNEKAYKERYGKSLLNIWRGISLSQQEKYLVEKKEQVFSPISKEYKFENDEILRILIGYMNKEQLEGALQGCSSVARILLWEPDEIIFVAGCMYEDITSYINDERIFIALGSGEDILKHGMDMTIFDNNILHRHVYAYGKYLEPGNVDSKKFIKLFEKFFVEMVSHMGFTKQYEHLVYENALCAINALNSNSTTNQLFNTIPVRDIPVIIVSAGPSLAKNCHELKKAKNKAIIVAVTHSMKILQNNDVIPDLISVIEPRGHFFDDFNKNSENYLLCCVYASKEYQETFMGKMIYFGFDVFRELFSVKRTQEESYIYEETGLSVFITGGFKNFILVGQDLAYDDAGISHASGEKEVLQKNQNGVFPETEGINGGIVKTREDWLIFKEYFEKRIREDNTLNIIDATEGGALIRGTRVMKLRDAIDEYCEREYPVAEWLKTLPKGDEEEKEQIDDWFVQLSEMNQRVSVNLDRIISLNEEILDKWKNKEEWDDDFAGKCKRYDVMYHIIMEGYDGIHMREYCRADMERYIEDAFVYEGDNNIEARMRREQELFLTLKEKLDNMQGYIRKIRKE